MSDLPLPAIPIPPPLRGAEIGSFAHDTIVRRLPAIGRRVLAENDLTPDQTRAIEALLSSIPDAPLAPPDDPGAPDEALWRSYLAPYAGQSWLEAPWFVAEVAFYRHVVAATGYFQPGAGLRRDPFAIQKRLGLEEAGRDEGRGADREGAIEAAIRASLWGNQADLSLWPAGESAGPGGAHLLADDTAPAARHIESLAAQGRRADLILDNAGAELAADLGLADALLSRGIAVRLHAKVHPTFVSDAVEDDVRGTVAWLAARGDARRAGMGARLGVALADGRLTLTSDWYWNSPLAGWELGGALREELAGSGLIISKGDANYRRWLGDRRWPFDAPLDRVLGYVPAPILLLRTCKSDVAAGLHPRRMAEAQAQDPQWITGGRWGVVQLVPS